MGSREQPRTGVVAGASAAWRGLAIAVRSPEVGRTYLRLSAVLAVVTVMLDMAGIACAWHWTQVPEDASRWLVVGLVLLRFAAFGIVLLAAPMLALFSTNAVFPFLSARAFMAGLAAVDPARAAELGGAKGLPLTTAAAQSLVRLLLFVAMSVGVFAISFVPIAGTVVAPVLQAYFTARALGWELLDPYFDKLGLGFDEQRKLVRDHQGALLGFALPWSFVMAIPFLGPVLFGLAQASAGVLVGEVVEGRHR